MATVTLQQGLDSYSGVSDTHMHKANADTNYNTATSLKQANEFANYAYRTLIKFDLSSLAGATINSAVLYLYRSSDTGYSSVVGVHRVFKTWTNAGATWNDWINPDSEWGTEGCGNASDGGSDNSGDGADYDRTATAEDSYSYTGWDPVGWWDWTITTAVAAWVAGDWANNGLTLVVSSGTIPDEAGFHSSEYVTDTSLRPKLVIDYTPASASAVGQMTTNTGYWGGVNA